MLGTIFITIYQIDANEDKNWAPAVYNFQWTPQTDPNGVVHKTIDYPGVIVNHATVKENHGILKNVRIPVRPHFGVAGVAPKETDMVNSIPPSYTGGNYPLLETKDEWVLHGFSYANYLAELGATAQSDIYSKSSVDLALKDAFRKARRFLMETKGLTEDEAISLLSVGVDFGVTQVVDGNWGVHAVIKKALFSGGSM